MVIKFNLHNKRQIVERAWKKGNSFIRKHFSRILNEGAIKGDDDAKNGTENVMKSSSNDVIMLNASFGRAALPKRPDIIFIGIRITTMIVVGVHERLA